MWLVAQTGWQQRKATGRQRFIRTIFAEGSGTKMARDMDRIERILQRPKLYNNIDGVGELGLGFMFLGFSLLQWLAIHTRQGSFWDRYGAMVGFAVLFAVIHYGSKAIKTHITYPRTGFVEYRKLKSTRLSALVLGCAMALLTALGLYFAARLHWEIGGSRWGLTTPVALVGLVFVVFYVLHMVSAVRWKLAAAAAMAVCSVAIAMLPAGVVGAVAGSRSAVATLDERSSGAWLLTIWLYGAILLTSGGISFMLYLRHTQPPVPAAE
jgi:hypothetical protein